MVEGEGIREVSLETSSPSVFLCVSDLQSDRIATNGPLNIYFLVLSIGFEPIFY